MGDNDDLSKTEAFENLVELGAALMAAEPVTGAAMMLAGKVPQWWTRRAGVRATAWWKAFLTECQREGLGLDEMRAQICEQMESNPKTADVIMGHMRDVLDTVTSEAVAILGSLRGAYYREERAPDGFFRGATELLMQCTEADLEELRNLTGRLFCIKPTTKSRTIAVTPRQDRSTGIRTFQLAQVELENVGNATTRQDIFGVGWRVGPLWKRLQHLFVSTGLARNEGQLYDFIVEHDEMRRLHQLIRTRGIRQGPYRYCRYDMGKEHVAELEAIPTCFGYGETAEAALEALKQNLHYFVDDAETAELVKAPTPS